MPARTPSSESDRLAGERLARIETTIDLLLQSVANLRDNLERTVTELSKRDEEMRSALNERIMLCTGRGVSSDAYFSKVRDLEGRMSAIEKRPALTEVEVIDFRKSFPSLLELVSVKNRLLVMVTLSGFIGATLGGLLIAYIFTMVMP